MAQCDGCDELENEVERLMEMMIAGVEAHPTPPRGEDAAATRAAERIIDRFNLDDPRWMSSEELADIIRSEIAALLEENERLKAQVMDLQDLVGKDEVALEFYATSDNWRDKLPNAEWYDQIMSTVSVDRGDVARAALVVLREAG